MGSTNEFLRTIAKLIGIMGNLALHRRGCGFLVSQALAGIKTEVTVLCSWARHFTLTLRPSAQVGKFIPGRNLGMDNHPISGEKKYF